MLRQRMRRSPRSWGICRGCPCEHGVSGIIESIDLPHGLLLRHGAGSLRRDDRGSVRHGIRARLEPGGAWVTGSTLPDGGALEMEAHHPAQALSDVEQDPGDTEAVLVRLRIPLYQMETS